MISQLNQAWLASCKAIAKFGNSFAATIMPGWAAPANHATIGVAETGGGGEGTWIMRAVFCVISKWLEQLSETASDS